MLNPVQLRSFCAVIATRHFTEAARRLGIRQSTVSQHIARLEAQLGRTLLLRDTHHVEPTAEGETLLGYAREILAVEDRAAAWLSGAQHRARIRVGVTEDLALDRLPDLLGSFVEDHPQIDFDLTLGLSSHLRQALDAGRLDLVMVKTLARGLTSEDPRVHELWREQPVWIGTPRRMHARDQPVPIVVYDDLGSVTRRVAIGALDLTGRRWRLAGTSGTLTGLLAAVRSGLGVSVQSRQVLATGVTIAPPELDLPAPMDIAFIILGRSAKLHGPVALLAEAIKTNADLLRYPIAASSS